MSKKSLAIVSLVAAIPAGLLTFLLASALLSHFGEMPGAYVGLAGVTLLISSFVTVLPVGIVLFVGRPAKAPTPKKTEKKGKGEVEEEGQSEEVDILDDEAAEIEEGIEPSTSTSELETLEGQFTDDNIDVFEDEAGNENLEEFDGFEIPDEDDEQNA